MSERKFEMSPTGVSFDSATMGCVQCKEMTQKKKLRRYGMTLSCSPFVANSPNFVTVGALWLVLVCSCCLSNYKRKEKSRY